MIFSRSIYLAMAGILIAAVCMYGFADQYEPPPFPEPDLNWPLDPPDPFDNPFDPINDLPLPEIPDFPPELPDDPFDDPFPLPDPPDIEDPFPDFPSLDPGESFGYANFFASTASTASFHPHLRSAAPTAAAPNTPAANVLTKLMPFPQRLPFHPANSGVRPSAHRRVCTAATATKLMFAESRRNTIAFYDTCPWGRTNRIAVGTTPISVAGTPDGQFALVTNAGSQSVSVVSMASQTVIKTISIPTVNGVPTPAALTIAPDGLHAYVADHAYNPGSQVYIIDLTTMSASGSFPVNGFPAAIAVSPDSSQVWVSSRGDGTLQVFDAATNALITSFNLPYGTGVSFTPNGSMVYAASGNPGQGYIQVIDATLLQPVAQIPVGSLPHVVAVTPSGHHVFVTNALSNTISQISTKTNKVIRTLKLRNGAIHPLGITFIR